MKYFFSPPEAPAYPVGKDQPMAENQKGFSLLEMIAAVMILTIGVSAIAGLINSTISSSRGIEERIIATYLAQEGVEVIRNIRDTSWIEGENWDEDLDGPNCNELDSSGCPVIGTVRYDSTSIFIISNPNNWKLMWDGTRYVHNLSGGIFSRHIELTYANDPGGDRALKIKSIVEWRNESVEIEEWLYEWQ